MEPRRPVPNPWTRLTSRRGRRRRPPRRRVLGAGPGSMSGYVGAIDQGTTSTRFILFDRDGRLVASDQREHEQITPRAGWVEHDPLEIWQRTCEVIEAGLARAGVDAGQVEAVGITNQRETTVVWDRESGEPIHNAIVWQDTRTEPIVRRLAADGGPDRLRARVGLPLASYFSGPKLTWLLEQVPGRARARRAGRARVRDDRQLAGVEADRRDAGRGPPHGRDQREPDAADGPRGPRLARAEPGADGRAARPAARDPLLQRDLRRDPRGRHRRTAAGGHPRRPAGGPVRPVLLHRPERRRTPTGPVRSCC